MFKWWDIRSPKMPTGLLSLQRSLVAVSAEVILAQLAEVKVDHLVEDGGFGTAHADSGADRGDTSVEASRQGDSRDRSRAWSVADYRATVFEGPEAQTLRAA